MKKKATQQHSNDVHLFLLNVLFIAGLIGVAIWLQKNNSGAQLIVPTASTTVQATNISVPSQSDVSYVPTTTAPIKKSSSTISTPKNTIQRHRDVDASNGGE